MKEKLGQCELFDCGIVNVTFEQNINVRTAAGPETMSYMSKYFEIERE